MLSYRDVAALIHQAQRILTPGLLPNPHSRRWILIGGRMIPLKPRPLPAPKWSEKLYRRARRELEQVARMPKEQIEQDEEDAARG